MSDQLAESESLNRSLQEELDMTHRNIATLQQEKHDLSESLWQEKVQTDSLKLQGEIREKTFTERIHGMERKLKG